MFKNLKKIALSLALLGTAGITPVVAEVTPTAGTADNPATAYLTKILQTGKGTTLPTSSFVFSFTQDTSDVTTKAIDNLTLEFNSSSTKYTDSSDDTIEYAYVSKDLFKDVTWSDTGIYNYTVTEVTGDEGSSYTSDTTEGVTDTMTYSKAEYKLSAYVAYDTDESAYYLKYVTVTQTKDDDGNTVGDSGAGTKIDPTAPGTNEDGSLSGTGGTFNFTNKYVKKITNTDPTGPDNPDPETPGTTDAQKKSLAISKQVSGDYASKTALFPFSITVTTPSVVSDESYTIKAKISGTTLDSSQNTGEITFESGEATTVNLKAGQTLTFEELYVGSKVVVSETDAKGHTKSATATSSKDTNDTKAFTVDSGTAAVTGHVSEGTDYIAYTNTYASTTPTGFLVDNLPYIALIGVTVLGFVAYVAVKRKTSAE